jgi:hypothetical protein
MNCIRVKMLSRAKDGIASTITSNPDRRIVHDRVLPGMYVSYRLGTLSVLP